MLPLRSSSRFRSLTPRSRLKTITWQSYYDYQIMSVMFQYIVGLVLFHFVHSDNVVPEQIHLSYGSKFKAFNFYFTTFFIFFFTWKVSSLAGDSTQMFVTWSTMNVTQNATCLYGTSSLSQQAKGYTTKFVDGGTEQHTQYIHRVVLSQLQPGKKHSKSISLSLWRCHELLVH